MKQLPLLLLAFVCTMNVYGQNKDSKAGKSIDTLISSKMKLLGIPGMAVAVVKNGKIIKMGGYGKANLEWDNPVTIHTSFQIASCTKLLTSTLLLKALYNGKVRLNDYVGDYIDTIPEAWKSLQIRHLISHSSGLREFRGDPYASTATVVKALKDSTLEYVPGKGQHYAQSDFMLMGYILEKVYGKPFTVLLHDEISVPLNMQDGGFDMEQKTGSFMRTNLIKQKATTYYDADGRMQAYKFIYPQYTYTAGGYFASISDMANWARGLDQEVLFPGRFSEELIYGKDSVNNKAGAFTKAGWILQNENGIMFAGHTGGPGLGDVLRFPKEGYTFIVLSNDGELLPDLARAIAAYYIDNLPAKQEIKKFER